MSTKNTKIADRIIDVDKLIAEQRTLKVVVEKINGFIEELENDIKYHTESERTVGVSESQYVDCNGNLHYTVPGQWYHYDMDTIINKGWDSTKAEPYYEPIREPYIKSEGDMADWELDIIHADKMLIEILRGI